jgi:hypothetical protein
MTRSALFFAIFLSILTPEIAAATEQSLESALNQQYHEKILALRHPLGKTSLAFDADGKVLTWKFDPARMDGKAVPVILRVEVSFNLF